MLKFSFLFLILIKICLPEKINFEFKFSPSELTFKPYRNYTVIHLKESSFHRKLGEPLLPLKIISFTLTPRAKITSVKAKPSSPLKFSNIIPFPAQAYQFLSAKTSPKFIPPKSSIYSSASPYPKTLIEKISEGRLNGKKIISFKLYPCQYLPLQKTLILYQKLKVEIECIEGELLSSSQNFSPPLPSPKSKVDYFIITRDFLKEEFEKLAYWKTKKGVRTKIKLLSEILTEYAGKDECEKIRNFIKEAYQKHATRFILLGGDAENFDWKGTPRHPHYSVSDWIIPSRRVYGITTGVELKPDEDEVPCDYYYACLDGTWDANQNGKHGEVDDEVDLYPEVFIGRAPVRSVSEAKIFVDKLLTYEKALQQNYQNKLLFLAQILFPGSPGSVIKEEIVNKYLTSEQLVLKFYEDRGGVKIEEVVEALNAPYHIVNHCGHALWGVMEVANNQRLTFREIAQLKNKTAPSIFYSVGCWPAAFDRNSIAEQWIINPEGGGFFIGNSRYGVGSAFLPGYGPSDLLDKEFFKTLFISEIYRIGETLAISKNHFVPYAQLESEMRYALFELNLLGDPEMPIWTRLPRELKVLHPLEVSRGEEEISILVSSQDKKPVAKARVCLWKEPEIYLVEETSSAGQVQFLISAEREGEILLTVTAHNFKPYEARINVTSQKVKMVKYQTKEIRGNNNGVINPGETFELKLWLKNLSLSPQRVQVELASDSPFVLIKTSERDYGEILPQESKEGKFEVEVTRASPVNEVVSVKVKIKTPSSEIEEVIYQKVYQEDFPPPLVEHTPIISYPIKKAIPIKVRSKGEIDEIKVFWKLGLKGKEQALLLRKIAQREGGKEKEYEVSLPAQVHPRSIYYYLGVKELSIPSRLWRIPREGYYEIKIIELRPAFFLDTDQKLQRLGTSSCDWGDYNRDGWVDLILCGRAKADYLAKIPDFMSLLYQNENGRLKLKQNLTGVGYAKCRWLDYNNDNWLDVIISGVKEIKVGKKRQLRTVVELYQNINGELEKTDQAFLGTAYGSITVADFTNDGWCDLVITGYHQISRGLPIEPTATFYTNYKGRFQKAYSLEGVGFSSSAASDYDKDGWQDLLISGLTQAGARSILYKNFGGQLKKVKNLPSVYYSSCSWGDINQDDYPELVLAGESKDGSKTLFFQNDSGQLIPIQTLVGVTHGDVKWVDYDRDGALELFIMGKTKDGKLQSNFYQIEDAKLKLEPFLEILGIGAGEACFSDLDLDGDVDIAVTGYSYAGAITAIYRNNLFEFLPEFRGSEYGIFASYPNPTSTHLWFPYYINTAKSEKVKVKIYNLLGQLVKEFELTSPEIGRYFNKAKALSWNVNLNSGVYFYTFALKEQIKGRKFLILK